MAIHRNPKRMIKAAGEDLRSRKASVIEPEKWQGLELKTKMIEVFDSVYRCFIPDSLNEIVISCDPDLPWANDHFQERIQGFPTNPGDTFKNWPYYKEDSYRENDIFTHTYQERFWPLKAEPVRRLRKESYVGVPSGIRYDYGNLADVINHLYDNPTTRQAFLPIWFPEDTGVIHKGRVPCTIGYLFTYKHGFLHITYYIRSCDYIRHFKNDVYFACRLNWYVLSELQKRSESKIDWSKVRMGRLKMDIESLHIFESDKIELNKRLK